MKKKMKMCCSVFAGQRKTFLIMRVSLFLILISALQVIAGTSYSQSARLSLNMKNSTIREVLSTIEDKSDFYFLYNNQLIDVERKVNFEVTNEKIDFILSKLFDDGSVNVLIRDRHIILTPSEGTSVVQQQKAISGKVTDNTGIALPGVSVVLKGTQTGTITNGDGNFSLSNIPENSILQFSFVGMKTLDVNVGTKTSLMIVMETETFGVDEVVVTALGVKRAEKALGYSVQKVSGETLQKVAGLDVATSLTGKIAGVLVKNSPDFASVPVVQVRGENALLVIDGVAYQNKTLADISPEDIESINILKGATASALYGFRGSNGAIMITTKNATTNKLGVTIDFTGNTMLTAGYLAIPGKQNVYGRGTAGVYNINSDSSWGPFMDGTPQNQWDPISKTFKVSPYLPIGANNFKNFLEQGYVTNNNLNIGFKKDNVSVRNSFNWTDNKGRYPNARIQKYTYSFGADIDLDKLKISTNMSYARRASPNVGSNGYTSYDPMYSLLVWSPSDWDIRQYKDNYWIKKGEIQNNSYGLNGTSIDNYSGASINNPYFDRYEKTNEISRDIFNVDFTTSYQIKSWLKATVRSGLDFFKERGEMKSSWGSYVSSGNTGVPGADYSGWNGGRKGQYNIGQTIGFSMNSDLLFSGDRSFSKFNVEYLAGGTIFYTRNDNMNASTQGGISVPGFFSIKASINAAQVSQSRRAQQVNSAFGRIGISWNKMAFIEATGRNDWSSTLAKDQRSYFYPSVAASFVASELLPGTKSWLDLLKFRGSWTLSKRPADIYEINSSYGISAATWGALNGASVPTNLYDPSISPTSYETFEQGMQTMFFKNRLMVDVSHYTKRTFDRITTVGITGASGYSGIVTNFGEEITRRGWELILNGTPIRNKDWKLDVGINWSTYNNYYTKLDEVYSRKLPWVQVGKRADHFISRDFVRVPGTGEIVHNSSGLPITYGYDQLFGYSDPKFIWGTNLNLRYKNFRFFMSLDGVNGGITNTRTESYMWQAGIHPNSISPERKLDVEAANIAAAAGGGAAGTAAVLAAGKSLNNYLGQGVSVVSGTVSYDAVGNILTDTRVFGKNATYTTYKQYMIALHNSSAWGGNGSIADTYSKTFFKLREISLTYDLPDKLLGKVVKAASISLIGQNVFLKAKDFKYSDPDGGNEDFADPASRYIGAKINFTL